MSKREVHILSYFSLETDLAGSMRDWPEFRHGEQYSVDLQSEDGEVVTVRFQSDEDKHVAIVGIGKGQLFDRVKPKVRLRLSRRFRKRLEERMEAMSASGPGPGDQSETG